MNKTLLFQKALNNPALSLLTEIVGNPQYYGLPLPDRTGKTPEETQAGPLQINLLSLGTGRSTEANFAPSFGGALAYAKKAIDISMFGNLQLVDYNLNQLRTRENPNVLNFEFNYLRLSPDITDHRYGHLDSRFHRFVCLLPQSSGSIFSKHEPQPAPGITNFYAADDWG